MLDLAAWKPRWPYVALAVSGALLAGAHAFESFADLHPCQLCLEQRETHWIIAGLAVVLALALRLRPSLGAIGASLIGLAYLYATYKAGYHVAVEHHWIVAQCDVADPGTITTFDPNGAFEAPQCDKVQWSLFGISMAGFNAIISLAMTLKSFLIAAARPKAAAHG